MSASPLADNRSHSPDALSISGSQNVREHLPLGGHVATIREMLTMLEALTAAGQPHSMSKIVDVVGAHVRHAVDRVGARNASALAELIAWLQHESERGLPDVASFCRRAEDLLTLLVAVG